MTAVMTIADYLRELDRHLHVGLETRVRLLEEARDHLEEDVGRLEAQGLSTQDAVRTAIRRFGSPEEVAARVRPELGGLSAEAAEGLLGRLQRHLERAPVRTYLAMAGVVMVANAALGLRLVRHYHVHLLQTRYFAWPATELGLIAGNALRDWVSRRGRPPMQRRLRLRAWDTAHPSARMALILGPLSLLSLEGLSGSGLQQLAELAGIPLAWTALAVMIALAWHRSRTGWPRRLTALQMGLIFLPVVSTLGVAVVSILGVVLTGELHGLRPKSIGFQAVVSIVGLLPVLALAHALRSQATGLRPARGRLVLAVLAIPGVMVALESQPGHSISVLWRGAAVGGGVSVLTFALLLALHGRRAVRDRLSAGRQ